MGNKKTIFFVFLFICLISYPKIIRGDQKFESFGPISVRARNIWLVEFLFDSGGCGGWVTLKLESAMGVGDAQRIYFYTRSSKECFRIRDRWTPSVASPKRWINERG